MIRVKKGNCQLIGNRNQVFSELSVATVTCAKILAKELKVLIINLI